MKTKHFAKLLLLACLSILFAACEKDFSTHINTDVILDFSKNSFTIKNITTGEKITDSDYDVNPEKLTVRNGDVLEYSFNPDSKYENSSFIVEYQLFDSTFFATTSPYVKNITVENTAPGEYKTTCKASIEGAEGKMYYATIEVIAD